MSYCFVCWFSGGPYMELECGFISYLPRNCVMKAIKSASNYDLMMPDIDSSPKKKLVEAISLPTLVASWLYQAGAPPFLQQYPGLQGEVSCIWGIRVRSWRFYHRKFPHRPRNRQGRCRSEVRARPETYSLAGLGASSDLCGRCTCVSHVIAIRDQSRSMVG